MLVLLTQTHNRNHNQDLYPVYNAILPQSQTLPIHGHFLSVHNTNISHEHRVLLSVRAELDLGGGVKV